MRETFGNLPHSFLSAEAPKTLEGILEAFRTHLCRIRGATASTGREYTRYVREFLVVKYASMEVDLATLSAQDLLGFVAKRATHCKPKTAKLVATALRSFLRFLQIHGLCEPVLVQAVPTIPEWKLSQIPKVLSDEQVHSLLESFDRATQNGRRNYAMALCLVRLGLRAGEVACMRLDDIDWRKGTLHIPIGKTRRRDILPLPVEVGCALVDYLRSGRPQTLERRIFVRHAAPVGDPLDSGSVRAVIRRAAARAKVPIPHKGTHALRHTAATRMLEEGATLKELADVLRHRSLDTTLIYTKVELSRLAQVALPWPEVWP